MVGTSDLECFRPLTGLSLYLHSYLVRNAIPHCVSVPSRGYLYIYVEHGSFSICGYPVSVPSRGYLYIYTLHIMMCEPPNVSVPSRGYLYIYKRARAYCVLVTRFPSPHGVISISTNLHLSRSNIKCHVSVPSRGYLYIYRSLITRYAGSTICFRPLTGLSLYLHDTEKSVING